MDKKTAPYGLWESPFDIEGIFAQASSPMYPFIHHGQLYWLEAMPDEGGRIGLFTVRNDEKTSLLPAPFNIRSKVHEYGGKCFATTSNGIVFNHFADGCLYFQGFEEHDTPICLTNGQIMGASEDQIKIVGYADLTYLPYAQKVIGVCEAVVPGSENENFICSIQLSSRADSEDVATVLRSTDKLLSGDDFYASPVVNKDETQLAWMQWSHPHMQWDQSRLMTGKLVPSSTGCLVKGIVPVVGDYQHSVSQPGFIGNDLVFALDNECCDFSSLFRFSDGKLTRLTDSGAEFGDAHWVFGQARWQSIGNNQLVAVETSDRGDRLVLVDLNLGAVRSSDYWYANCCHLSASENQIVLVTSFSDKPAIVAEVSLENLEISHIKGYPKQEPDIKIAIKAPQSICFPTRDGEQAYGYFYPPNNDNFVPPEGTKPPLLVLVHGGPTSRSSQAFAPLKHYFASLGFALFDVNHRGSTGHGRAYRQRLLGQWGEIDVADIADGVRHLLDKNRVSEDQIFIRGGSAGGYAVLRALTEYGGLFAGGACYYGIGNLITLSEITHKFESRYTDGLIGEPFDSDAAREATSLYYQRSPIFHIDRLVSPLIVFQGLEDKVVPPAVSQELVQVLENKNLYHRYFEYAGEGHGFRKTDTRVHSLVQETEFFATLIRTRAQKI